MTSPRGTATELACAERLASLSHAAKLSYRAWAQPGWEPPVLPAERARWARRLGDPAGWTLIAFDSNATLGTVHFTDARTDRGAGEPIAGRAHLSGLFVLPARWAEGIGSTLLEVALVEMRSRGYREAQRDDWIFAPYGL